MNKYGAKKTTIDGLTFDSKAEASRYQDLKLLERAGVITDLKLQPVFILQPAFTDAEKNRYQAIKYRADFQYTEGEQVVIEEVKGFETEAWKLRKRLFLFRYPQYVLRVVK